MIYVGMEVLKDESKCVSVKDDRRQMKDATSACDFLSTISQIFQKAPLKIPKLRILVCYFY